MSASEISDLNKKMYHDLVASWTQEQVVEHIMYWREKSDGLTKEVEADKLVKHLRRRIQALTRKLRTVREAAVNYKRCRDFSALVRAMEGNRCQTTPHPS